MCTSPLKAIQLGIGVASALNLLLGCSIVSIAWTYNVLPPSITIVLQIVQIMLVLYIIEQQWVIRRAQRYLSIGELILNLIDIDRKSMRRCQSYLTNILLSLTFLTLVVIYIECMRKIACQLLLSETCDTRSGMLMSFLIILTFSSKGCHSKKFQEFNENNLTFLWIAYSSHDCVTLRYLDSQTILNLIQDQFKFSNVNSNVIHIGLALSVYSSSFILGTYSFVTYEFQITKNQEFQRSFLYYSVAGLLVSVLIQVYFAVLISNTVHFEAHVMFLDILLRADSLGYVLSIRAFLILLFFAFSHKIGLFILLAKRTLFQILVECKYRAISRPNLQCTILNQSRGFSYLNLINQRTYEDDFPFLYFISGVSIYILIFVLALLMLFQDPQTLFQVLWAYCQIYSMLGAIIINICQFIIGPIIVIQRKVRLERSGVKHMLDWGVLFYGIVLILFTGYCTLYSLTSSNK